MKNLGEFKCPRCGWVHIGTTEEDARTAVADFNAYYATLSPKAPADSGAKPVSIESYKGCLMCGAPAASFLPAAPGDAPDGSTLPFVIAPDVPRRVD